MQPRCYVLFFLLLLVAYSSITSAANATVSVSWTNSTVAGTPELELLLVTGDNPLLPADALFQIQLNSRFAVASDASVDDAVLAESLDSTWSYLVDTKVNTLAVQRSGNGSQLSSGTQIRFKLTGVTNPSRASQFSVGTMQISDHGATFTQLLELQPIEIVPGDLLNSQLSFSNLLSGRSTLLTIHLTVSHSVPHDGAIVVYLPYVYGFLVGVSLSSVVGLDGEIEVSTKDNAIWLKRKAASGTNSGVMQEMVISLAGIVHPKLEGYMGRSVLLQTLDVDTGVIDQAYVDTSDNVLTKAHVVLSSSIVQISEGDLTGAQYTISLSSPPSGDSGLTISIGEIGSSPMLKVDPQLVVFSTANWSSTATITVVASKDVPANETRTQESVAGISHTILSGDSGHTFAAVSELSVRIIDNDFPFQSACFPCPEGFYCPKSSASPVPCANGTYSVNSGTTPCEKCSAGFACSDPTLGPVKCPSGSYSLADSLTCTICPNGKFCPSTDQAPQTCNSGYYSTQGSTLCTTCPRGFQCNGASMSEPVPCAYSTYSSVEGAVMCLPCPVGHSCLDATQPPVLCQPGSFSLDGKGPCTHCPKGYKCATTTDAPVQCVDGTYSPVDAVDCLKCPAGKYCPQPSSDPISCSVGYYSVIGSTACIPCPAGMECASPSSIPVECPSGTYTPGPASSCLPCPSGSACATATATPTVCDPGTFSAQGQMKCTQCSAGYYCPQTGQAVQLPCLPGTYAEAGATACTICPAGMQCPSITQAIKEPCKSGTFSLGGQARCIPCPIGHKCPQVDGSLNVVCDPGWYSSGGAVQCTICPAGYACPNPSTSSPVICPDGYYSLTGAKVCVACPAGYACPDPTSKLLVPCAKGTYSTGAASSCTPCPAGFACSFSNSSSVEPCQTGFYSTTGSGSCVECPRGYYCDTPNEMPKNCSLGYYSLRASTSCLACDPGYECPRSDQLPQPCPVGYYSVGAVANCRSCSPGYKCSLASTNPTPKEDACPMGGYCNPPTTFFLCPAGTFGNVTAGESIDHACAPCPEGYYCEMGTTPLTRQTCPAGFFCPEGTKRASQNPCPAGTFNPNGGQKSSDVCQICPAGMYCPTGSSQPQSCPEGYYCPKGTRTANQYPCAAGTFSGPQSQLTIGSQCNACPLGNYCPEASSTPTKCPAGTYNPQTGAADLHECLACPPGWSCPHVGQSDYVDRCAQGHYCPGRTVLATDHPCPAGTYTESVELIRSQDCTTCPLRHACLQGTGGERQTMLDCGAGFYCPNGTEYANQFPCLPGTWSSSTALSTASECDTCPPGKYCEGGKSFIDGSCAPGHYCPLRTYSKTQFPCPSGTYTANTWLSEPSQCDDCPPGYYCPAGSVAPIPCKAGSYTPMNNTKTVGPADAWPACITCPAGYYCIEATVTPKPCGKGKFSTSGSKTCPPCEAGYFCNSETTSAANMRSNALGWASPGALYGTCYNGSYCPAGSDSEPALETDACPPAYYCPTATPAPVICPAGTYSNLTGQDSISDCTPTPAGYFSVAGALEPTGVCSPGFYCPLRSTSRTQVPCPARYYLNRSMGQSEEDCAVCVSGSYCPIGSAYPTTCPAGYYCRTGISSPEPCPIGTYATATGLRTVEDCMPCPPGLYCDSTALTTPRGLCDPGYYCTLGAYTSAPMNYESTLFGVTNRHTGDQCPQGAYCPLGSSSPTLCPPGTFNNFTGLESVGQCVPCPPGEYCETPGLLLPTDSCHPGFFCIGGAAIPTQMETPAGSYSLIGATAPSPCPPGQYNLYPAQDKCLVCPAGFYCSLPGTVSPSVCPTGNYCPQGTSLPVKCLPGTFADVQGLVKIDQCEPCPSGQYCDSYGLSAPSGSCLAGFVCVGGSPVSNPVAQIYGDICPVASYCPEGTGNAISCPAGSFRDAAGGASLASCSLCPGGQHCSATGLTKPSGSCSPGYYCVSGAASPTPTDSITGAICPAGFYCPEASSAPIKCSAGTYAVDKGQSICDKCPMGYFCDGTATNTYADCPAGHYCPAGTGEIPVPCAIGTFSNSIRLTSATECQNCTPGYFCSTLGLAQPTGPCAAGSYCPPRAESSFGRTTDKATHVCPSGFYCPEGTYLPIPCPIGTYSNGTGLVKTGDCVYCDEGSYCADAGLVKPSGLCKAGYYCKRNNTQPNPSSGVVKAVTTTELTIYFGGQACPTGSYCPQGSTDPILCPEGSYTDVTASSLCMACPPGYFCPLGCSDYTNIECPRGHYCPKGTQRATQYQCPPGSFGNRTGLQDESQCTPAPGGTYINEYAAVKPTGNCKSGFYCSGGSSTSTPAETTATGGPCLPGTNCPEGSAVPIVCDAGGYCPSTNVDVALPCSKGFYCVQGSFTGTPTGQNNSFGIIGDVCKRGHYCPQRTSNPIPCPPGTFSDTTQNANASFCLPCPPGFICSTSGIVKPYEKCPGGFICTGGESTATQLCPKGHECPQGSSEPRPCLAGTFADEKGLAKCKLCPSRYYCAAGSIDPEPCPPGYLGRTTPLDGAFTSLYSSCEACPPGTFSIEVNRTFCDECLEGYVCLGGTNSSHPASREFDKGYPCPPGSYCPAGSSSEIGCPAGTFQPNYKASNESACLVCPTNSYQNSVAQASCLPCSSSAFAAAGATKCTCVGSHRAFQMTDGYCICEPGYEFYDQDMILRSDEDGEVDCQPIVYDRCRSNQVRSDSGSCVPASGKACDASCNNGTGTYVASLGVCQCDEQPDLDIVCNQKCRDEKTQVQVNGSTGELQLYNPITHEVSSLSEDGSTNGLVSKVSCTSGSDCQLHSVTVSSTGFSGSYDLPPLISDTSRRRLSIASTSTSILNPMVCLTVGNGLLFDLSVAGSYPIYMKDSMLNTNPGFDYGAFRSLAAKVNSNSSTVSAFAFSFTEAGTYVFGNSLNAAAQTIVVVMKAGTSCPTEAPIVPLNEKNLITVSAKRRTDDIILAPDWGLIVGLLAGLFGVVIALIAGLYYFRAKSWTNTAVKSVQGYRAKNKLANLAAMHSKGTVAVTNDTDQSESVSGALLGTDPMTQEKKQFHPGKQEQVKGATMEYRPDFERWDEEDLDLRELVDRLQFHHEAVTKSFEDQKGGVKELMQRLQAEAVELKRLFVNALVTSDLMSPEAKNPTVALESEVLETLSVSPLSGRPRSRSVAGREKFLLENLERDLQDRNRFEQKKNVMMDSVSAGLHEIEGWGTQLAELTGAIVQDMSSQLDDRAPERTSSKEETCLEHVRSVLGELKTLLGSDPMTQTSSSLMHLVEAEKGRREVGSFVLEASQRYFTAHPTIDGVDQELTNGVQRVLELHDNVEKAQNKEDEALFQPLQSLQKFGAVLPQVLAAIEDLESSFHRELDAVREEQNPVKEHAVQAQMQSRLSKLMKEVAAGAKRVNEKVSKEAPRTVKLRHGAQQAENALSRFLGSAKEQWTTADQERRDRSAASAFNIKDPESAPPEDQAVAQLRDKTLFEVKDLLIKLTTLLQRNGGASISASQQLDFAPQLSASTDPRVTADEKRAGAWTSDESYPQDSVAENERQRDNLTSDLRKTQPPTSLVASTHIVPATRQAATGEMERDHVLHREVEDANDLRTQHDEEEQSLESQFREEELAIEQEYLRELSSLEKEFGFGSGDEADGDATEPPENLFDAFYKDMEGDEHLPPRLSETRKTEAEMSEVLMDDNADIIAQLNDVYSEAWNNRVQILAMEEALRKEQLNERIRRKRIAQQRLEFPDNLNALTLEALESKDAILEEIVKKQDEMDAQEQEAINSAVNHLRKQVEDCQGRDGQKDRDAITKLVTGARNSAKEDRAKAEKAIVHAESELQKLLNEFEHDHSAMRKDVEAERLRLEEKLKGALAKRHRQRGSPRNVEDDDELLEQSESGNSDLREDFEAELEAFTDSAIKELRDKHFQAQGEIEAQKVQRVISMAVADAQLAYLDGLSTERVTTKMDDNSLSQLEVTEELLEALAVKIPMHIEQLTHQKVDKLRAAYVLSCGERRRELEADAAMRRAKLADRMNRRRRTKERDAIGEKAQKPSTTEESETIDEQERVALAEITEDLRTATEALDETERKMCEALAQTLASTLQKYRAEIDGQIREELERSHDEVGSKTFVVNALDALEDEASQRAETEAQARAAIEREIERMTHDRSKSLAALTQSLEVEKRRQEQLLKQRLAQRREQQQHLLPLGSSPDKLSEMNAVLTKQEVVEKLRLEGQLEVKKQRAFDKEREKQRDRESQLEQQLRYAFVAETAAAAMKEAVVQARSEYLEMGSNDEGLASLLQLWNARQAQKHLTPTGIVLDQKSVITTSANSTLERLHEEHDREWEALKARHEDETQRRKDQLAQRLQRKRQILRNNTALSPTDRARAESALDREQEHESQAIEASAASLDRAITLAIQGAKDRASEIITGSLASNTADLDAALETTRRQHEEGQRKLRGDLETERRKQEQLLRERLRQRRAARRDGVAPMVKAEAEEAEEADMKQKLEEKLCAQEDEAWAALREREQQELDAILAPLEAVVSQRLDDADLAERRARQELSRLAEEHNRHLSELRESLEAEKKRQQLALRDKLQRKRDRRGADGVSVTDEEALEMERQAMEALDASFEADLATAEAEAGETRREKEIELLAEICACSANRTAEEGALTLLDGARLEAERVRAEYEAALASRLQRSAAADALRREEMAKRLAERKLKRRHQREQQALQETTGIIAPLKPPFDSRHNDREDDGSLDREIANVQAAHARGVRSRQEQLDAETAARRAALAARLDHKRRAAAKGGESRPSAAEMEKALLLEEQQELAAIERDRALREKELKAEAARERERLTKTMREADESGAADIERQLAACKQAHDAEAAKLEEALRAECARQELALKQRLAAKRQRRAADGGDTEVSATSDQEAQEVQAALSEQERAARQQLADRQQQELADVARNLEQEAEVQRQAAFDLQAAAERELKRLEEEHTRERRALQTALLADKQKREDQLREKLAKKKAARQAKGFESQQDAIEEEIALAALQEEISREQAVALANERERQEAAMRLAAAELQEAAAATAKAAAASRQAQEEAARVAADFDRHRGESQQLEAVDIAHTKQKLADRLAEKKRKQQRKLQQLEKEQVDNDDATRILQEEAERLRLEAQIEAQLAACREAHDAEAAKLRESLQAERERQEHALQERIARRKEKRSLAFAQASARVDLKAAEESERKQQLEEEAALATALAAQEQEAWETIQRKQDEDLRVLQEQKHQQEQERAERQHQLAQKEMNRLQEEHERELRALTTSLAQEQARQEEKLQQRIAQRRARKQRQEEEAAATSAKEQQSIADAEEAARLAAAREREEALAEAQAQAEAEAEEKERQEIAARLAQKLEEERARQRREKDELEAKLTREAEEQAATRAAALALQFQQQALETGDKMAREFDTNLRELRETHSADGAAQKARLESRIAAKKARKLRELEEKRELERQRLHTRQLQEAEEAARAEQEREAAEAARQAVVTFAEELAHVQPSPDTTLLFDDETAPKAFVVRQQQPTEEDDVVAELRGKLELEAEDRRRELEEEKRVELERLTQDELRQVAEIDARVKTLLADERAAMIELLTTRLQSLPIEMVKQREAAEREHAIQLQRLTLLLEGRGQQQKTRVRARMVQKRVLIEDEFSRKVKLVTAAMNQRFMQEKMGLHLMKQTPIAPMEETHVSAHEETQGQDENQSHSVLSAELVKRLEEMLEDRLVKIETLVTEFQVKAQAAPPAPIPPKEMDPEEPSNSLTEYQIAIAEAVAIGCRYEKRVVMDKQSVLLVDSFGVLDASVVTSELPEIPVNQLDDRMRARLGFVELLLHSVSTKSEPTVAGAVVVEHFGRGNNGDADYASFSPPKQGQSEKGTLFLSRAALQELSTGQLAVVILHALAQGHTHTSNLTEPQFICHLYKLLVRCYQGLFAHFQQERAASTATAKLPRKSAIAEVGKTISSSDKTGSGHWQARLLEVEGFLTRMETRNSPSQSILRSESSRFHLLTKQREAVSGSSADLWQQEQVQILQEKLDSAEKLYLQVLRQHEQQTQSVEYWQDLLAEQRDAEYEDDTFDEEGEAEGEEDSKEQDLDAVERQRQREVRAQELQGELERTSQALEGTRKERDELFAQCQQLRDQLNELRSGRTTN